MYSGEILVNHVLRYSLSRILIGIIAITILSGYIFESTRAEYGSYINAAEEDFRISDDYFDTINAIYGTENEIEERLYFWIDIITSSVPFAFADFFSFGILSDILHPRSEFGVSFHYKDPAMEVINLKGPNTVYLITSALILVLLISIAWLFISKLLKKNEKNSDDIKQEINPRRDHILMVLIIFIPLFWTFFVENHLANFIVDIVQNQQIFPIASIHGFSRVFVPLIDFNLFSFDITLMNLDWFLDRIIHLFLPSLILLLGLIPLLLLFNRFPRVTEKNLPDTSFHLNIKSKNIQLRLPAIFFIGFILFLILTYTNTIVENSFSWPGISRGLETSFSEQDWAMTLAYKITLCRIIVWLTVIIDIIYYLFSNYRIKKQSLVKKQEIIA